VVRRETILPFFFVEDLIFFLSQASRNCQSHGTLNEIIDTNEAQEEIGRIARKAQ